MSCLIIPATGLRHSSVGSIGNSSYLTAFKAFIYPGPVRLQMHELNIRHWWSLQSAYFTEDFKSVNPYPGSTEIFQYNLLFR